MSDVSVTDQQSSAAHDLRRDLRSVLVDGHRRAFRIVIDEVSGRFARVSEHVWQSLSNGERDPSLWQEARSAGWTRQRSQTIRRTFSPLFFRIPIGTVDPIASRLARASGIVFSTSAILCWTAVIALAAVLALSHSSELARSFGSLQLFLQQSNPFWLGMLFVGTKVAHELAHGVMCRRMGSRCGSVGLLFLCGVPCPYCDVTDIWRHPSSARRAAVMLAGIYVELIIAAIATIVWVGATDPVVQLSALNLMAVCGISTIVFNANPLMRYDGYYVFGDIVGSANLRQESGQAFRSVVTTRFAGSAYQDAKRTDVRSIALASFHAASTLYRLAVAIAIATLLISVAGFFNLRPVAVGIVVVAMITLVSRSAHRVIQIARGVDRWGGVPTWRRGVLTGSLALLIAAVLFTPIPRYRSASGRVDVAKASSVFLTSNGMIDEVTLDFGDTVESGATLLRVRDESLAIQQAKLRGQLRVARLRSDLSRHVALDRSESADQWNTLQAAEDAVAARLASVTKRVRETDVLAPVGGVIVPPPSSARGKESPSEFSLRDRVGMSTEPHTAWCRISSDGSLHAVLVIDARDRTNIDVGAEVRINLRESPENVFSSRVISVSAIEQDRPSVTRQAAYQVLCPLPAADKDEMLRWLGKNCQGVFHLPNNTLASDLRRWISEWLGG